MSLSLADIKPSLLNFFIFAVMLILTSNVLKYLLVGKFQVPGLTPLVANI